MLFFSKIKILSVIVLFSFSSFTNAVNVQSTPQNSNRVLKAIDDNVNRTPGTIINDTSNYCKLILHAITNRDTDDVIKLLKHFFDKIPYPLRSIENARNPYIKNNLLYKSMACTICHCLQECANKQNQDNTRLYRILFNKIIYLPIQYKKHLYVFQFSVQEENKELNKHICYVANNTIKNITIIDIEFYKNKSTNNFEVEINQLENKANIKIPLDPVILQKDNREKYKNYKYKTYKIDHVYKKAFWNIQDIENANRTLRYFYSQIPYELAVPCEKYYHALLFSLLKFIGVGEVFAEYYTKYGRPDIFLKLFDNTSIIIELKYKMFKKKIELSTIESKSKKLTNKALKQICEKEYYKVANSDVDLVGLAISETYTDTDNIRYLGIEHLTYDKNNLSKV